MNSDAQVTDGTGHDGPECPACYHQHQWGDLGRQVGSADEYGEMCPRCGFTYSTPASSRDDFDDVFKRNAVSNFDVYQLPDDEAERRMPALSLIENDRVRKETRRLTARAPPYFWVVPASTSDYHHPACRETRGLWAHTLMVSTVIERLVDSYTERHLITDDQADLARAAAILHDQRKNGDRWEPNGKSVGDHDLLMADVVKEGSALPEQLSDVIARHMGPWYDGPSPATPLDELVHQADMVASTADITAKVPGPIPEELAELGLEER